MTFIPNIFQRINLFETCGMECCGWAGNRLLNADLWEECPNASWLLAASAKMNVSNKLRVKAGCGCAYKNIIHISNAFLKDQFLLIKLLELSEAWADNDSTIPFSIPEFKTIYTKVFEIIYNFEQAWINGGVSNMLLARIAFIVRSIGVAAQPICEELGINTIERSEHNWCAVSSARAFAYSQADIDTPLWKALYIEEQKRLAAIVREAIPWSAICSL